MRYKVSEIILNRIKDKLSSLWSFHLFVLNNSDFDEFRDFGEETDAVF